MEQDLNQQLPTHYSYAGVGDVRRMTITADDNYTTRLLRFTDIKPTNQKSFPYFAINLFLAQQMGWIQETASNVHDVGNNLTMELNNNQQDVKADPASYLFEQTIYVYKTNSCSQWVSLSLLKFLLAVC